MVVDLSAFVATLARNMPAGFTVRLLGQGEVVVVGPVDQPAVVDVTDAVCRGAASSAVAVVLDAVQDHVTVELCRPWPELNGQLALPALREADGEIEAWFGPKEHPVLKLGTFPVLVNERGGTSDG